MILFERLPRLGVLRRTLAVCMILAETSGNGVPKVTKVVLQEPAGTGASYVAAPGPPAVGLNCNPPTATSSIAMIAMSFTGFAACWRLRKEPTIAEPVKTGWLAGNGLAADSSRCGDWPGLTQKLTYA